MKLLVYGSHTGEWDAAVGQMLDFYRDMDRHLFLVLPFEPGVCGAAWRWAQRNGVPCQKWIADVFTYDKAAGYERNKSMVADGLDAALLFDGGYLHQHLADLCRSHGVFVSREKTKETVGRPTRKRKK